MKDDKSKYEATYMCGYCREEYPITDKEFEFRVKKNNLIPNSMPCGHPYFASSIKCKLQVGV